jgi:dipeptidyl-peptidase 4
MRFTDAGLLFLRSRGGADPVNCLWFAPITGRSLGEERLVVDPLVLSDGTGDELTPAERARRERMREQSGGITAYSISTDGLLVTFIFGGSLWLTSITDGSSRRLPATTGAYDPRLSPDGKWVAYVADGAMRVIEVATGADRLLASEDDAQVTWGVVDFAAAEELNRYRGFWWAHDSQRLIVSRVDNNPVQSWWIGDLANPHVAPTEHRYPAAGTANADVSLWWVDLEGKRSAMVFPLSPGTDPQRAQEYVLAVRADEAGVIVTRLDREQRRQTIHRVGDSGVATLLHSVEDPIWLELVPGTPRPYQGSLLHTVDEGNDRLLVRVDSDGALAQLSPASLLVNEVHDVLADGYIIATCTDRSVGSPFTSVVCLSGAPIAGDASSFVTVAGGATDPGVHTVSTVGNGMVAVRSASLTRTVAEHNVLAFTDTGWQTIGSLLSLAEAALVEPAPIFYTAGVREVPSCVLLPSNPALRADGVRLPVVMDPYGGPHAARVIGSRNAFATSQWLADQGFAVVIVDGRGTPGIGPEWERAVHLDLAGPVLADQVVGLLDAAANNPQLDLTRVGIRGWSFGGYLAALAVLRRPDVFHCAVAGAPVIDWRLYDTGYTERYLGNPSIDDGPYEQSSLLRDAAKLTRPIQLIHGLADDNVVAAHTIRFSSALMAAGVPHELLPLAGVTHMTPQEEVAENLLLLQVDFLHRHLGRPKLPDGSTHV